MDYTITMEKDHQNEIDLLDAYFRDELSESGRAEVESKKRTFAEFALLFNEMEAHYRLKRKEDRLKVIREIAASLETSFIEDTPMAPNGTGPDTTMDQFNSGPKKRRYLWKRWQSVAIAATVALLVLLALLSSRPKPEKESRLIVGGDSIRIENRDSMARKEPGRNIVNNTPEDFLPDPENQDSTIEEAPKMDNGPSSPGNFLSPDGTLLVDYDPQWNKNSALKDSWEREFDGSSIGKWMDSRGLKAPEQVEKRIWRRVAQARYIGDLQIQLGKKKQKVDSFTKLIIFSDPKADSAHYHFDENLYLFLPSDPDEVSLRDIHVFVLGHKDSSKYHLLLDGQLYQIKRSKKGEGLKSLKEETDPDLLELLAS